MLRTLRNLGAAMLLAAPLDAAVGDQVSTPECSFHVTTGPFVAKDHRLIYYKDGSTVLKVDGREYSGTDGDIPEREIRSISAQIGSVKYDLPSKAFASVFNPHLDCLTGCTLKCTSAASLRLEGGDGAGGYTVEWTVDTPVGGAVIRRIWEQPDPEKPKESRFRFEAKR